MADEEAIRRKRDLLEIELQRYFGQTCPALAARWEAAIVCLAPTVLSARRPGLLRLTPRPRPRTRGFSRLAG